MIYTIWKGIDATRRPPGNSSACSGICSSRRLGDSHRGFDMGALFAEDSAEVSASLLGHPLVDAFAIAFVGSVLGGRFGRQSRLNEQDS